MTKNKPEQNKKWGKGWEGHRIAQLLRMAKLSFKEKLIWLDEAQKIAGHFQDSKILLKHK